MKPGVQIRKVDRQDGVALGIVVWFIAGMALLVSGIVAEARIDTKMAQLHYFKAKAAAAGDGAIQLVLAEQVARKANGIGGMSKTTDVQIGGNNVALRIIPAGLLVNISTENIKGLTTMFSRGLASVSNDNVRSRRSPDSLARAVIRYRDGEGGRRGTQFHSLEDLMRVPGVDRAIFDAVRDYIVIEGLAGDFTGQNQDLGTRLRNVEAAMSGDGAMLNGTLQHMASELRIDALVEVGDRLWLRRRWVKIEPDSREGLPWKVVRSEPPRTLNKERPS